MKKWRGHQTVIFLAGQNRVGIEDVFLLEAKLLKPWYDTTQVTAISSNVNAGNCSYMGKTMSGAT